MRSELHWLDKGGSNFDPPVGTQINMGPGDLVQQFTVIGDTRGDDIGKTSVSLRFNPISVTATQVSDCIPSRAILKLQEIEKVLGTALVSPAARAALVAPAEQDAARLKATVMAHRPSAPGK
jgi:hypothetical protein